MVRELLQVLSADEAQQVLQHVGAALMPGGRLFIIGQILDDTHTTPREAEGTMLGDLLLKRGVTRVLSRQFLQQRLRPLEVGGVIALGAPDVHRYEPCRGFRALAQGLA